MIPELKMEYDYYDDDDDDDREEEEAKEERELKQTRTLIRKEN